MIEIVSKAIDQYIEGQYQEDDSILREMQAWGEERDFPLVGPQVGRLLFILTKLLKAERVLEMGSGYGYSAYWSAKALPTDGKVIQTEFSQANSKKAREFFKRGGLSDKAEFFVGDALKLVDEISGNFDIIFLDLNKEQYPAAFKKAKSRLKAGGLLLADNTLWFGRVIEDDKDPTTQGIREFTQLLFGDKDFFATILPVRDGVALGYKLK